MTLKTYEKALCASAFLAAIAMSGGAFAVGAAGDSYSFEEKSGALSETGLTGSGTYATVTPTQPTMGYPMAAPTTHATVLGISGTVAYTNDVSGGAPSSKASQVDFMFKVEPTDELEEISDSTVQVALAVGTNIVAEGKAPLLLWCKAAAGDASAAWKELLPSALSTGTWVRATLFLDYNTKKCKVSINGDLAMNGSSEWFLFANDPVQDYVKSISMVGSTEIDDLVISHKTTEEYYANLPGGNVNVPSAPEGVTYADINKYGITVSDAVADNDVSGCNAGKISQKLIAGLNPKSPTKFELKTMTPVEGEGNENKMKVTFPGDGSTYTVSVSTSRESAGDPVAVTPITTGKTEYDESINEVEVTLEANALNYIRLKATK